MARTITMIPATKRVGNTVRHIETPKLKVAAYCRVSTDTDEQATSYEAQVEHYTEFIRKNPEWEFAGIYADDGISGTNTKKREEFNRMIADCNGGKIDMIITKSISRFARNTLDCLSHIRELKALNIPVFFEKENINTMDAKGEVLLTIMASLAQQESESLSQNVKMGFQFRYQNGQVSVNHNRFMGYTKDKDGNLVVDESEAKVVRRIFREYLEGCRLQQIAKGLEEDGILTGAGKKIWRPETVHKMLKNEKYMGDALLQKTYTVDVLTKKRVVNDGIVPQYYVENSHEPIVSKDVFIRVQEEMARRANLKAGKKRRVYSSKYALSSMVFCSKCGDIYRRVVWNNRGKHSVVWRCCNRVENGPKACDADSIPEVELQGAVIKAFNQVYKEKKSMIKTLQTNLKNVLESNADPYKEIDRRLDEIQKEIIERANARQPYPELTDELRRLRAERESILVDTAERKGIALRIKDMTEYLNQLSGEIEEYDESLVRNYIERIDVVDNSFDVKFKTGIVIEIKK